MKKLNIMLFTILLCQLILLLTFYSTNNSLAVIKIIAEVVSVVLILIIILGIRTRKKYVLENKVIEAFIKSKENNKIISKFPLSIFLFGYLFVSGVSAIIADLFFYFKR